MHTIARLNREIYKCISEDILTEDVIITPNQIQHIKERHPNDYENFSGFSQILLNFQIT